MLLTYDPVRAYEVLLIEAKYGAPRWPAFAHTYGFDPARPVHGEVEALSRPNSVPGRRRR